MFAKRSAGGLACHARHFDCTIGTSALVEIRIGDESALEDLNVRKQKGDAAMEQKAGKSNVFQTILIAITLLVDGLGVAGLAYIFLIFMAVLDPVDFDVEVKYANIRQGEAVFIAGLIALLFFLLTAIFWRKGKRIGKYVAASLCIFSLCTLSILPLLLYSVLRFWPLLVFVLVVVGLNVFALLFIFAKGKSAILEAEQSGEVTT